MKFHYTNLETCHTATGLVVVIDVVRAFTNAAYAFSRGAQQIHPVKGVQEALDLRDRIPGSLVCGEEYGVPPEGFDFGNSPTETRDLDLQGRTVIQRTGAGTQGIVRSLQADTMLAASLVVAGATVRQIHKLAPDRVTFVITGQYAEGHGDEDLACANYLESLLNGHRPEPGPFIERIRNSPDAAQHLDPALPQFPESDLDFCTSLDAFPFAMPVSKENGLFVIRPVIP